MIEMLRVDDRLIHGQIVLRWTKYLMTDSIILANDVIVSDKNALTMAKLAAPAGIKVAITSVADGIMYMNDPRLEKRKVLTIVNNLDDALTILKAVPGIKHFNIGNYGANTGRQTDRTQYSPGFRADVDEIAVVREILKLGIPSTSQLLPDVPQYQLAEIIDKPTRGF